MRARLLLAGIVFPAFTLTAQPQASAATSRATPAARAGNTRLDPAHARLVSIDHKRFNIAPANRSHVRLLERRRSAVFLGVLDSEVGAAEEVSLLAGRFSPYPMPGGVGRAMYAEPGEGAYFAGPATDKPHTSPSRQPTFRSGRGCWYLWVFTGKPVCWRGGL